MNEFLEQFIIESRELAEQASSDLLALENDPHDKQRIDSVFRAFHTLKGGAGIVDFAAMGRALHAAESLLSAVRAGQRRVTADLVGDCLMCLERVFQWLDATEVSGTLPQTADAEADEIVLRLARENGVEGSPGARTSGPSSAGGLSTCVRLVLEEQARLLSDNNPEGLMGRWRSAAAVTANVLRKCGAQTEAVPIVHMLQEAAAPIDAELISGAIAKFLDGDPDSSRAEIAAVGSELGARSFRVDAGRVDALVNLTGELTVEKNALGHLAKSAQEGGNPLASALALRQAQLERLVSALQHSVLEMRVLPLRHVAQRFPRLVREISVALGKQVRLVIEGDDTEADKAVVEALYDPLLHVLRNAVDHGVEPAAQRAALGKPQIATIHMRAYREGDHVIVEVEDDGGGIDVARIRDVATGRGLLPEETLAGMSDAEISQLIFEPGFSTTAQVSEISGRGVGMDAVRTAVAQLGGRVLVDSTFHEGTLVRFVLPFSVMMTQLMIVEAGGQMFGIPLEAVLETSRVARESIEPVGAAFAVVHRGRTLPVFNLAGLLNSKKQTDRSSSETLLVVVSANGIQGALEVDRLGGRADVMLKPLGGLLSGTPGLSGTTLLGDGTVLLVLDVASLLS